MMNESLARARISGDKAELMPTRLTHYYDITARQPSPTGGATPADFELAWTASSHAPNLPDTALAYCADFAAERVLFSLHEPAALVRLFGAPFLFPEQAMQACGLASVPFERLAECGLPGPALRPCFVFSPGRTGSTLLVRLLGAAGLACVSEPDMLQQVVWMEGRRLLGPETVAQLAGSCIAALGRARGDGLFIKLRSQCNKDPLAITRAAPGCRAVFMLRQVAPWALSRHRVFHEPPAAVAAVLRQAIDALDKLSAAEIPLDILWFETLAADPVTALQTCAPRAKFNTAALASVMARDSQEGTGIARKVVGIRPTQHGFMADFAAAWAMARDGAVWRGQTENLLSEMWQTEPR